MADQTDADIIQRVLDGDADEFSLLMERYQGPVLTIVKKRVPRGHIEDVAQDAFVRAFQSLNGIKDRERFKPWISSIAVRACYDFWRKVYRNRETPESDLSTEHRDFLNRHLADAAAARWAQAGRCAEARDILDWALDRLSPGDRAVLELIYLDGYSGKEAASMLGWSVANIKIRAFRSRKKLEKLLIRRERNP